MNEPLYKGKFLTTYHIDNEKFPILKNVWEENSKEMVDDDFKHEVSEWCKLVEQHHYQATIVDTLQFGFIINPDLQDWYNTTINSKSFEEGMRKMAFIVPKDLFSQVSIEQIFDDQKEIVVKYFTDEADGLAWING